MMQLTATTASEVRRTVTRPGALLEIGFDRPLYLSTRGARSWAGHLWEEMDYYRATSTAAVVASFEHNGSAALTGSVRVNTVNRNFAARCKEENIVGRTLRIWTLYGTNPQPAADDPVLEFDGFVRSASLGARDFVTLNIVDEMLFAMYTPREFWNEVGGYSTCAPEDKILTFADQDYRFSKGA